MVTGPATVIDAIKAGQTAARAIDAAIRVSQWAGTVDGSGRGKDEISLRRWDEEPVDQPRVSMPKAPSKIRRSDFREVELGYTLEMALAEACRCLRCDVMLKVFHDSETAGFRAAVVDSYEWPAGTCPAGSSR